jgi:tetratricopeptide (TPR) repeat protein
MRLAAWATFLCLVTTAPAWADEEAEQRAAELFHESAGHYRAGRFDRAIALLEEAHRLSGAPVLLFNLAKAYEGKGDQETAIRFYERYLAEAEDVPDRGALERKIATLRAQIAKNRELQRNVEAERRRAEEAEREKPSPSAVPWVLAGAGFAGLAVGVVLGVLAKDKEDEVEAEPVQLDADALLDEAERLAIGANVAFAVGGALALAGATWGIVDVVLVNREPEVQAVLEIGATGVALTLVIP